MKLKILLFLALAMTTNLLSAQVECDYPEGVNDSIVISEARMRYATSSYIEITNVSSQPLDLSEYKLGRLTAWSNTGKIHDLCQDDWYTTLQSYMFLPQRTLEPGESFVITNAYDFSPKFHKEHLGRLGGSERVKQEEIYEIADKLIHLEEPMDGVVYPGDSVTTALNDPETPHARGRYDRVMPGYSGETMYLEHHYTDVNGDIDSAVVDQVGGFFDNNGSNKAHTDYDVAGVEEGMATSILVRKNTVQDGTIDFASASGISIEDSEWIPLEMPDGYDAWRDLWWIVGNHGNYTLDENTLEPKDNQVEVDFAGKKITVPWGTRRLDDIMRRMKKKPGIAWKYDLNSNVADSLYRSAKNGDQLTIYVVGNGLQTATFDIVVEEPTADDNIVIPIDHKNVGPGPVTDNTQNGILGWPRVTRNESGTDTITGAGYGLEYGLSTDSLLKYLEMPENASFEFVWVDGQERPDLKDGDKLKVISQSDEVKEYYIQLQTYEPSQNAYLSSITWPDIPDRYKGKMGWTGDTIPNFASGSNDYRVNIPIDVDGIPALVAKADHPNAEVKVHRATSLNGTIEDATVVFEVFAEADTVKQIYRVQFVKEKNPDDLEPFSAEPFISEFDNNVPNGNAYLEIYNPGTEPIDLRNYMIGMRNNGNPSSPITSFSSSSTSHWNMRYTTYIPGMQHVDEQTWAVTPRILRPDFEVNPYLQGGETFVMCKIGRGEDNYEGMVPFTDYDVQFLNEQVPGYPNPWGEYVRTSSAGGVPVPPNGNRSNSIFMYKVLNDSVKLGLKPNTDPNDFELIDYFGMGEQEYWTIGGVSIPANQTRHAFIRKPEVSSGNPILTPEEGSSFGTTPENTEWTWTRTDNDYGHIPYPERHQAALNNLGSHYMAAPTYYRSTVKSLAYKVSTGYGEGEEIVGIKTGTTVSELFGNLIKVDEDQTFIVKSVADAGVELGPDATLSMDDELVVTSADSSNITFYRLDVSEQGLSSDAVLTSDMYDVEIQTEPGTADGSAGTGTISGIEYGKTLQFIADNVSVPSGATMTIINSEDAYVPFKMLNFDTTYVEVTVNPDKYIEVVAEDNVTKIIYQLQPESNPGDAFILSDFYTVKQSDNLVVNIPRGTSVSAFYSNVVPSLGASMQVVDKMGFERNMGELKDDDNLVVTSADGETTRVYHFSLFSTNNTQVYLAYVLSNSYSVDQLNYVIEGASTQTTLEDFYSNLIPVEGASVIVVDSQGNEKTGGNLEEGDELKVFSMDERIVVIYQLNLTTTGVDVSSLQQFEVYPNPSDGELNVSGLTPGNRVQLINTAGVVVRDLKAYNSTVSFNMDDQPRGLYIIAISDNDKLLGVFKAMVQ